MGAADDPVFLDEDVGSLAGALGKPAVELHRQPERVGERLDRFHAAGERARNDPAHLERTKELDELSSLLATSRVKGAQAVVTVPVKRLSGGRVPDENARHRLSRSARLRDQRPPAARTTVISETIGLAEELCELLPRLLGLPLEAWRIGARGLEQKLLPSLGIDLPEQLGNPLPVQGSVGATGHAAS